MTDDIKKNNTKDGVESGRKSTDELKKLAENAIDEYFETIESVINDMAYKIADANKIENEDDINFLKKKIERGILKMDG